MSSMRGARNNTLAGVFVIASIITALVVVILLGGALERLGTRDYSVRFDLGEGVMGIVPGAKVSVGGRDAGTVKRLRFEPDETDPKYIVVTVSVDRHLTLRQGAVAQLNAPLLGGTGTINFPVIGSGPPLTTDDLIEGEPAPPAFLSSAGYGPEQAEQLQNVFRRADEFSAKLNSVADEVQTVVADAKSVIADVRERSPTWFDRVDSITKNVDDTTAKAPQIADDLQARLNELQEMFASAQGVIDENRPDFRASVENARSITEKGDAFMDRLNGELVDKVKGLLDDGQSALTRAREAVDRVDTVVAENTPTIRRSAANLRLASDQLAATLSEVRRSPWRLLYRPDKRELEFELLYDSAALYAGAISDLRNAADTVEALNAAQTLGAADPAMVREAIEGMNAAFERYKAVEQAFLDLISERAGRK